MPTRRDILAISGVTLSALAGAEAANDGILLDPQNEECSFGINLLACKDINSLTQRVETYTRAKNVFEKIWEDDFGPWLQLILQNTLYAFVENPEFTLAEVPAFLEARNTEFRNYIARNIKHNDDDRRLEPNRVLPRLPGSAGSTWPRHALPWRRSGGRAGFRVAAEPIRAMSVHGTAASRVQQRGGPLLPDSRSKDGR
jgi:hypothetical protein